MGVVAQPSQMRQQPQQVAPIDWSNPITQGLTAVVVGSLQYDPVSGKPLVNSVANARTVAPIGRAVDGRLGQTRANLPPNGTVAVGAMFAVAMSTDATTEQVVIEVGPASAFADGTRGIRINAGKVGAYTRNLFEVNAPYVAGTALAIGSNYNGSFMSLNLDGLTVTSGTTTNSAVAAAILNVGGITGQTAQYYLRGPVTLAYTWSRNLTDAEYASLAKNPWQIFKAPARRYYAAAIAAPTSVNADIAWAEDSDAYAIAIRETDRASVSWSEADDATSITANASNRAAISWAESNDQCAVAVSASDASTIAWSETDDIHALVAAQTDRINISWAEPDDSHTLAGTVQPNQSSNINAALSWVEADDTSALAGSLRNRAAVSWAEVDDISAIGTSVRDRAALAWAEADDLMAGVIASRNRATIAWAEQNDMMSISVSQANPGGLIEAGLVPANRHVIFQVTSRVVKFAASSRTVRF
jgi:hypothetical protein